MTPPDVTLPVEVIKMSSGVPAFTVDVRTGPVTGVEIGVSAATGAASAAMQDEARSRWRMESLWRLK